MNHGSEKLSPEQVKSILDAMPGAEPVLSMNRARRGVDHIQKAYRYKLTTKPVRHIAVVSKATRKGVTAYINATSVNGAPLDASRLPGVSITRSYPRGFTGKNGAKGFSTVTAALSSLDTSKNEVACVSIESERALTALLEWYCGTQPVQRIGDALDRVLEEATSTEDERVLRAIKTRRGQPAFRSSLLEAYGGRCCVTGCDVEEVLEAAHIVPHKDSTNYEVSNGLLLRSDIHVLFDLGLICIDECYRLRVSSKLGKCEYSELEGLKIGLPKAERNWPSVEGLKARIGRFQK